MKRLPCFSDASSGVMNALWLAAGLSAPNTAAPGDGACHGTDDGGGERGKLNEEAQKGEGE